MVGWKSETIEVIRCCNDWIAGDVILIRRRGEDRLNELSGDAYRMISLHIKSTVDVAEDAWREVRGRIKSVRS